MKEHPILFKTEMVQAIMEGRKSQTRRVIKPQPELKSMGGKPGELYEAFTGKSAALNWSYKGTVYNPWPKCFIDWCCKWKAGDLLWVKETSIINKNSCRRFFVADGYHKSISEETGKSFSYEKVVPSIFMPKLAARIWLEITDVKVERLQDISLSDAEREGAKAAPLPDLGNTWKSYKQGFEYLWQSINGVESWNSNPFVWVITFKRIDK